MLFPLAGRPDKPFHSEPLFNDSGAVGSLLLGTRCSPGNTKALSVQNRIHITRKIMKPNAFHTAAGIFQRLHTGIRSQNVVFVPSAVNWWTINDKASGWLVIVGVSAHTHAHTHLTAIFLGIPKRTKTRKVKPIWILLKQETVSGSGPYASLHLAPDRQPCQHPTTSFLLAGCPSCRPTNSVKALKSVSTLAFLAGR